MFWKGVFNIALGLAGLWLLTLVSCEPDPPEPRVTGELHGESG